MSGTDLITEAGGGIVAVELEYRLGIFGGCLVFPLITFLIDRISGFLSGKEVKDKGALNAGLRE